MSLIWHESDGRVTEPSGSVWALVRQPPTDEPSSILQALNGSPRLVVIPTFADIEGPTWLPAVRDRWNRFASALAAGATTADGRLRLFIMPTASAIVSDLPGTLTFLRTYPAYGLVVDPAALLTQSMLRDQMDHLVRIVDALVGHPACEAVVMGGGPEPWEHALQAAALSAGKAVIHRSNTTEQRS